MKIIALLVTLLCLTACSTTNISELVDALGKDQATVCFQGTWGPGVVNFARTNLQSGDVKCGALEVHSQGGTQLPVTVTPVPVTK